MAYGSATSFTVTSTASGAGTTGLASAAGTPQTFTGTDVQGTINGQAATGTGQLLLGAANSRGPGPAGAGQRHRGAAGCGRRHDQRDHQTISPGSPKPWPHVAYAAANPGTGTLANAITGEKSHMSDLSTQISNWNPILQEQQTQLENEYNAMEATLASLKSTQNALAQYFNQSSTSSNGSSSGG